MSLFIAPRPTPLPKKATLSQFLRIGLRSALSMFLESSYGTLQMGQIRLPTFPFGKTRSLYVVRAFDILREVLVRRAADFPKSMLMGSMLNQLLGNGVFVSNGKVWRRQRRMMDPAFAGARIREVFPMMRDAADAAVARLDQRLAGPKADRPVMMDVETTHFTADIIFRTIFSQPIKRKQAEDIFRAFETFQNVGYAHGFLRILGFPTRVMPGALRGAWAARRIRMHLKRPLDARLEAIRAGRPTPQGDILASLIAATDPETGTSFDRTELLDQIAVLFLAGHETSASTLAWAMYLLASCPHLQERAHEEAVRVFRDRPPEFADIKKLAFTRDVVRETLRLYPPVAFVARDSSQEEHFGPKTIPPRSVMFIPLWLLHRHREHWVEADGFDPDRFSREESQEAIRCAYMPFSMGPRVCVGAAFAMQETVLYVAWLVRHFRFSPTPGHTPQPVSRLTLRSLNGIPLMVERR
jgi:cytochrome P450